MIFQIWIESPDKSLKLVHFATCALTIRTCPFWSLLGIDLVSVKILSCEPKGPFPSPICACKIDIQFCDSLSGGQSILSGVCCCRGTCFPLLCRNINIIGVVNEINLILIVPIKSKWPLHLVHLILPSPLWNPWVSRDKRERVCGWLCSLRSPPSSFVNICDSSSLHAPALYTEYEKEDIPEWPSTFHPSRDCKHIPTYFDSVNSRNCNNFVQLTELNTIVIWEMCNRHYVIDRPLVRYCTALNSSSASIRELITTYSSMAHNGSTCCVQESLSVLIESRKGQRNGSGTKTEVSLNFWIWGILYLHRLASATNWGWLI